MAAWRRLRRGTCGRFAAKLTAEDYFAKSDEFKVWLVKKRRKHFEDLSTEEAHALFDKFVAAYNDMSLDLMYYTCVRGGDEWMPAPCCAPVHDPVPRRRQGDPGRGAGELQEDAAQVGLREADE